MKNFGAVLFYVLWMISCQDSSGKDNGERLNLENPKDNLEAFVKMRASLDTNENTVYYWTGRIYGNIPGERARPLFDMEAMNIALIRKVDGGYQMLTREVALYQDLNTGEYLSQWDNPYTGLTVDVIHVWNDPVNQSYLLEGRFGPWGVPYKRMGNNRLVMYSDIWLFYPSPLPVKDYPLHSRSDMYQAAELFQFFMNEDELLDPHTRNVYSEVGWTRISDFLPWMNMGNREGHLVYQCRGYKIDGDFEKLPEPFKAYILEHHPEYATPPDTFVTPNMTSWTYFKKVLDEKM
ncbi:MAG TPA: DUF1838 family protein [Saprospiraceae bacterium]|nr:DUF1838 family protein [Saprospiraceae bacterium]